MLHLAVTVELTRPAILVYKSCQALWFCVVFGLQYGLVMIRAAPGHGASWLDSCVAHDFEDGTPDGWVLYLLSSMSLTNSKTASAAELRALHCSMNAQVQRGLLFMGIDLRRDQQIEDGRIAEG